MADRKKVIKAIDICLGHGHCDDCEYKIKGGYSIMDCRKPMMRDALELLKEQESKQVDLYENDEWWSITCPDCQAEWMSDKDDTHFCPRCGKAVILVMLMHKRRRSENES